jgi:hypothetical protein
MTVSRKHGVKMAELKNIVADTGMNALYFVVPSTVFAGYPKQNLLTVKDTVARVIPKELKNLKQFALAVEI